MMRSLVVCAVLLASAVTAEAQAPGHDGAPPPATGDPTAAAPRRHEEGRPFIRAYAPTDVGGNNQVWAIVQDKRGVIYAGTGGAVLEFDGASWRRIPLSSLVTVARSMAIDDNGRIYVGAADELGYLEPDAKGELRFVSLLEKLPASARAMGVVWRTLLTPQGVVFQSETALYRWSDGAFTIIPAASKFRRASVVDGRVYVVAPETGLNIVEHDVLQPLPGTTRLVNEPFPVILRYDQSRLLIGTRSDGLFLYDGTSLTPFPTEFDSVLKSGLLYRGISLRDGTFALTTTSEGMGIVDRQGHLVAQVSRTAGLPSDVVYFAMQDAEDALWLAHDIGVSRVEIPSPVSFFDQSDGLSGAINTAIRHDGRLYFALQTGVRYLDAAGPQPPRIVPVAGSPSSQCWTFAEMRIEDRREPALLVTCGEGLYEISGTTISPIKTPEDFSFNAFALKVSSAVPSRVWVGVRDGLASFRREHGRWVDEGRVGGVTGYVRSIFENPDGSLWAGTETQGVLRVTFPTRPTPDAPPPAPTIQRFGTHEGLPNGGVFVVDVGGRPYFYMGTSDPYVAHFDEVRHAFVRETAFDVLGVDPIQTSGLIAGPDGRAYFNRGRETGVFTRHPDGSWTADTATFDRFGSAPLSLVLRERDSIAWVQQIDLRLVRFDTARRIARAHRFGALVRRVTVNDQQPIFGGAPLALAAPRLGPSSNALRFEFAAPDYLDERATQYQSRARGFRARVVGLGSRFPSRLHQPAVRRLSLPCEGAHPERSHESGSQLRIHDPAAVVSHVVGISRVSRGCGLVVLRSGSRAARPRRRARSGSAPTSPRRSCAPRPPKRWRATESEGKKNVELLSEIGREITASLDIDTIFGKLYDRVNELADAEVFGVGLYHPDRHEIEYQLAIEKGKRYAPYTRDTSDRNQLPVWCIEHKEPVFINDSRAEYAKYIERIRRAEPSPRGRLDVADAAVDHLHAARSRRSACSASSRFRASRSTPTPITT